MWFDPEFRINMIILNKHVYLFKLNTNRNMNSSNRLLHQRDSLQRKFESHLLKLDIYVYIRSMKNCLPSLLEVDSSLLNRNHAHPTLNFS